MEDRSAPIPEERTSKLEIGEGRLEGLLCSCNARSRTPLVGHAQWETNLTRPQVRRWESSGRSMRAKEGSLDRSI